MLKQRKQFGNSGSSWGMRVSKIQISMALIYWWKAKAESLVARLKPKLDGMGLSLNFPTCAFRFGNKSSQMMCHLLCS